jgi:hypothetical protein
MRMYWVRVPRAVLIVPSALPASPKPGRPIIHLSESKFFPGRRDEAGFRHRGAAHHEPRPGGFSRLEWLRSEVDQEVRIKTRILKPECEGLAYHCQVYSLPLSSSALVPFWKPEEERPRSHQGVGVDPGLVWEGSRRFPFDLHGVERGCAAAVVLLSDLDVVGISPRPRVDMGAGDKERRARPHGLSDLPPADPPVSPEDKGPEIRRALSRIHVVERRHHAIELFMCGRLQREPTIRSQGGIRDGRRGVNQCRGNPLILDGHGDAVVPDLGVDRGARNREDAVNRVKADGTG